MGVMSLTPTMRLVAAAALATAALLAPLASGQAASCTTSLLTSFTPCFSFLTNSSNGGSSSPTRECCRSLAELMNASTGCACLVLTGAVPLPGLGGFGVPVNRTLALSLPKACGDSMSVPLQCRDTSPSAQSPAAAGPVADTPTTPPASPAAATTPEAPATPTNADPTATAPVVSQGQTRQTVLPNSARRTATGAHVTAAPALALLLAVVAATLV